MAKKAIREREQKRTRLEKKYRKKTIAIKDELQSCYAALEHEVANDNELEAIYNKIDELQVKLQKVPRNATKKRQRNRCELTGRPRGYYRKFRLSRNMLRKLAMMGLIPGIRKASW